MRSARPPFHLLGVCALLAASLGCDQKPTTDTPLPDKPTASATAAAATTTAAETETPKADDKAASGDKGSNESADDDKAANEADKAAAKDDSAKEAARKTKAESAKAAAGKADTKAEETEVKKGEDVGAASFSAWLQASGSYEAGKQGTVTAVLVAKPPYKCNAKYPYKFKGSASEGVTFPEATVRGMQVSPKRSTMSIPFVPTKSGKATVSGELSLSVCTDERCLIEKRNLSVTVDVK